jgi:hypothetical protein
MADTTGNTGLDALADAIAARVVKDKGECNDV